nr:type I restriction endonuclease [uncultured Agathobaculum sp.]
MDFIDQLKQFSKRVESLKDTVHTEEATKTSLIMPFFAMLGYDVFNPQEFVPEFTADVGIKKGEKVDYAIIMNDTPAILVECKAASENLERHDSQLFRYFGTTSAKFAILTNGIIYRFYTDLEDANRMDETPFLEVNMLDIKDNQVPELKKFSKTVFDIDTIFDTASRLKYANQFREILNAQLESPSDDFVRLFLQDVYSSPKTQSVIEKFRPIVKKSLNDFISEILNEKLKTALGSSELSMSTDRERTADADSIDATPEKKSTIVTTEEELEAYFIVKNMLSDVVPHSDITYKDTESYINVLYRGNTRKWICRLRLTGSQKLLIIPDENKKDIKYPINDIYELNGFKEQLIEVLKRYV